MNGDFDRQDAQKPTRLRSYQNADATARELLRLWAAGEQFYPYHMKREIIALADAYLNLRERA